MEKQSMRDPKAMFDHCKHYTDKKQTYNEGNRNNYLYLLSCNCNRRGLTEAETLYFCCEEFDLPSEEIKATVASAYRNKSEHSTDEGGKKLPSGTQIDKIEEFLRERYEFRFNEITSRLEYKPHSQEIFQPLTDYKENSLLRELKKAKIKCGITTVRTLLYSDFSPLYNPFQVYFDTLPPWNDTTDHIKELSKTVETTHPELWEYCFRKWIIAMVGCAIENAVINHTVIVFTGNQGLGKTTWHLKLMPSQLKEYYYSGTVNPNNKDTLIHLSECLLINLDELENLSRTEIGALKEIITKSQIRIRRPYGHSSESTPRRASFAGSVNTAQFLNDTTGSRRFLCFEVTRIQYDHKIDMDKVFAQAFYLFRNGEQFWFDQDEIKLISSNNDQYQLKSAEEELLITWFEKPDDDFNISYLTTSEIAARLNSLGKINVTGSTINKLGKALHKHSYERIKRKERYVYKVRERTGIEVEAISKEQPKNQNNNSPETGKVS